MTFVIRIEKTASHDPLFAFAAVVDGMEEQRVHAWGPRPWVAIRVLAGLIDDGTWDHIDPDAFLVEGITIEGQAQ